jgi:hypothetical protein
VNELDQDWKRLGGYLWVYLVNNEELQHDLGFVPNSQNRQKPSNKMPIDQMDMKHGG